MELLVAFLLPAVLFLAFQLLWGRPPQQPLAEIQDGETTTPDLVSCDPLALPQVYRRLEVLAAELERLEHDESIFARAFRWQVATIAYEALVEDASRLSAVSHLAAAAAAGNTVVEIGAFGSSRLQREELVV
jgi:hypothetical protein